MLYLAEYISPLIITTLNCRGCTAVGLYKIFVNIFLVDVNALIVSSLLDKVLGNIFPLFPELNVILS